MSDDPSTLFGEPRVVRLDHTPLCVAVSPAGDLAAVGEINDRARMLVHVFDTATGEVVSRYGSALQCSGVALGDGELLYLSRDDGYRTRTGLHRVDLTADRTHLVDSWEHDDLMLGLVRDPVTGVVAITGSRVVLVDPRTDHVLGELPGVEGVLTSVAFLCDGRMVVVGERPGVAVVRDVRTLRELATVPTTDSDGRQVVASADGRVLLAQTFPGDGAWLYDVATWSRLQPEVFGDESFTSRTALSPDGRWVFQLARDWIVAKGPAGAYARLDVPRGSPGQIAHADRAGMLAATDRNRSLILVPVGSV